MMTLNTAKHNWTLFAFVSVIVMLLVCLTDMLYIHSQNLPYFDNSGTLTEHPLSARTRDYLYKNMNLINNQKLTDKSIETAQQNLDIAYAFLNIKLYTNRYPCTLTSLNKLDILSNILTQRPIDIYQYNHTAISILQCTEIIQTAINKRRTRFVIKNIQKQRKLLFAGGSFVILLMVTFKLLYRKNRNQTHHWQLNAMQDALTGVLNRRAFNEDISSHLKKYPKHQKPFSLLMCDVDFFKQYNDALGHIAGDQALKYVAETLKGALRDSDEIYRYGGEEFIIILMDTTTEQAEVIGLRILELLREQPLYHPVSKVGYITVSIGCATLTENETTSEKLINKADQYLYMAKENGRNCLISSNSRSKNLI